MKLIGKRVQSRKFRNEDRRLGGIRLVESAADRIVSLAIRLLPVLLAAVILQPLASARPQRVEWQTFMATAYSVSGETKAQTRTQEGRTVAADVHLLPIGTVIEVRNAGPYSGQYVVEDTGESIVGRKIDIYMARTRECIQFGRRKVKVRIVKRAPDTPEQQRQAAATQPIAPKPPKQERVSAYYQYPVETAARGVQ